MISLKNFQNNIVAHNLTDIDEGKRPEYGDAEDIFRQTLPLLNAFSDALYDAKTFWDVLERDAQKDTAALWTRTQLNIIR